MKCLAGLLREAKGSGKCLKPARKMGLQAGARRDAIVNPKGRVLICLVLIISIAAIVMVITDKETRNESSGRPSTTTIAEDTEQNTRATENTQEMQSSRARPTVEQGVETRPEDEMPAQTQGGMEDNPLDEQDEKKEEYFENEDSIEQRYTVKDEPQVDEETCPMWSEITLMMHDGGFFTIEIPEGWELITAGEYSTFTFVAKDPENPLRQVFYFGAVGPFYTSKEQKEIDSEFVDYGGNVAWLDMPVIDPLTVENMFRKFDKMAESTLAYEFIPECPVLAEFEVFSSQEVQPLVEGSSFELIRGLFRNEYGCGEGIFLAGVAPFMPFTGMPMGGNAFGVLITGVTAPIDEFKYLCSDLMAVLESFTVSGEYITEGMESSSIYNMMGILKEGKTLEKSVDIMSGYWEENKNGRNNIE